jgi:hypothetical protein
MFQGTLSPVATQEDWKLIVEIDDEDTGEPLDLTGATIVFEARDPKSRGIILSATTGNGKISILDTGVFQVLFARFEMQGLAAQNYEVGCVLTINGETKQYIIGTVPILDGVVTQ